MIILLLWGNKFKAFSWMPRNELSGDLIPLTGIPMLVPWRDKQRWECRTCGICCKHFTVTLGKAKLAELIHNYGRKVVTRDHGKWKLRKINGRCIFQDSTGLCRIHEKKPKGCELFPFYIFQEPRHNLRGGKAEYWAEDTCYYIYVNEFCPGFGQGKRLQKHIPEFLSTWKEMDVPYPHWTWPASPSKEQRI